MTAPVTMTRPACRYCGMTAAELPAAAERAEVDVKDAICCDLFVDPTPCCQDPGCNGSPCTFPGYADNH